MVIKSVVPHILCGGSGSRLWPLSRENYPKQFIPLIKGRSLLGCTLSRSAALSDRLVCIANSEYRFLVDDAAREAGVSIEQLLEPVSKNTAAALACAALRSSQDELLLFLPADHFIPDVNEFKNTICAGIEAANADYIVIFGVPPTYPSTAYGYIKKGTKIPQSGGYQVEGFIEKPVAARAQELVLGGGYLWNSGIFLVRAGALIAAFERHAPDIFAVCKEAVSGMTKLFGHDLLSKDAFENCRNVSFDYAVMEKHDHVALIPFRASWSDVGSWNAVAQLFEADSSGNRIEGRGYLRDCRQVFISAPHRPVVAMGLKNTIIIDTPDAVLAMEESRSEEVKTILEEIKRRGETAAHQHQKVFRPWGNFEHIDAGPNFQVKRLSIKPGAKLSLQVHRHRAEHWVVVSGSARVIKGDSVFDLHINQSTYIPPNTKHRLENLGDEVLQVIEVQTGVTLSEDDIIRIDDDYGRAD